MGRNSRRLLATLLLLSGTLLSSGCVSLARTQTGSAPASESIAALQKGASLGDVLALCGVPLQTLVQPDGLLLIYRERHYNFKRIGFEPSTVATFVDFTRFVREALANFKLVLQWGDVKERRLVVLFDEDERLLAYAHRDAEGNR